MGDSISNVRQRGNNSNSRNRKLHQKDTSASTQSRSRDHRHDNHYDHSHDHDSDGDQDHRHNHEHDHHHDNEPNVFVVFMIFNVFVGVFLYAIYYLVQNPFFMTSCTAEQPLVKIHDDFLPNATFGALTDCLYNHPLVIGNELDNSNFKGTRGFAIKFSEEGISDFRSHQHFSCLVPYFDAVRLSHANAFVINLLICELESGNDNKNEDGIAVGTHLDNTIGIRSWRHFLAHQVNVLYAIVPKDMKGGELHVFPFEGGRPGDKDEPVHRVAPQPNRMVTFKGNAYHRVMMFKTSTNELRISLVVEQYEVPDSYKSRLIRSKFENRSGLAMM